MKIIIKNGFLVKTDSVLKEEYPINSILDFSQVNTDVCKTNEKMFYKKKVFKKTYYDFLTGEKRIFTRNHFIALEKTIFFVIEGKDFWNKEIISACTRATLQHKCLFRMGTYGFGVFVQNPSESLSDTFLKVSKKFQSLQKGDRINLGEYAIYAPAT